MQDILNTIMGSGIVRVFIRHALDETYPFEPEDQNIIPFRSAWVTLRMIYALTPDISFDAGQR